MAATKSDIAEWFDRGVKLSATHLIVVCDTYDHEDYPTYVYPGEDAQEKYKEHNEASMQRVMEVYNLALPKESQLAEHRALNY